MIEQFTKIAGIVSSTMVIITFLGLLCKPVRTKIFAKLSADKCERNGICALLRMAIISECKKAQEQGFMYFYDMENLRCMFENYTSLGGNHGIKELVEQTLELNVKMYFDQPGK